MSKDSSKKPEKQAVHGQKPEPAKPHEQGREVVSWSPVLAVIAVIVLYFAAQFIGIMLVSIYPRLHHWSGAQAENWLNNSVISQFFYVIIAEGLTVFALWKFLQHYKFSFGGIGLKKPKGEDILYALSGFAMYFVAYVVLLTVIAKLVPSLKLDQHQDVGFQTARGIGELVLTAISLVILPPIVEEILMRGFLYTSLKKSLPKLGAALVTSLIFASAHLPEGGPGGLLWVGAIDTFVLSMVLVFLREKTGRLWASMGLHGLKNTIAFIALFGFHAH